MAATLLPQPDGPLARPRLAYCVLADIFCFVAACSLAFVAFESAGSSGAGVLSSPSAGWSGIGHAFLQAVMLTLLAYSEGVYRAGLPHRDEMMRLAKSALWAAVLVGVAVPAPSGSSPLSLALASVCGAAALSLWRAYRQWSPRARAAEKAHCRNVLIAGATPRGRALAAYLQSDPHSHRAVAGFLDDRGPVAFEVIGHLSDLERIARAQFIDEVLIALDDRQAANQIARAAIDCRLDVGVIPDLPECAGAMPSVARLGPVPLIHLHEERPPALKLVVKRWLDVVGALVGLVLASPLLAVIAALVRLDSPGPVLYSAWRAGLKGRRFRCHKFRTMVADADAVKQQLRRLNQRQGPIFKIEHDPRITRLGRVLRKYSLDELPQLWNVLRGDMSLVGPRPHPLDDFAGYQLGDLCRLDVRPGMTGLWQTTARRDPSFQTSVRLDREYIENWSLALDFRILFRTFGAVLAGGGC